MLKKICVINFCVKNFRRMRVADDNFLTSDFFHTCVAVRIMEELSRLNCVRGFTTYMKMCGMLTIGEWMNGSS